MSVPPSYVQHQQQRVSVSQHHHSPETLPLQGTATVVEDCRDYLRTGRCKYGVSCKYNHPANVQSGGGMKTPINPSEPMFPLRPNEPICQYYMKHGTCKFGQACKFNHPPLHHQQQQQQLNQHQFVAPQPLQTLVNNGRMTTGPVLMSLGSPGGGQAGGGILLDNSNHNSSNSNHNNNNINTPHQLLCNPIGTDPASGSMILQFLPQRPDEPDCIYFLKNGRCKYGATCRYHHPITFHQLSPPPPQPSQPRRAHSGGPGVDDSRRQQQQQHSGLLASASSNAMRGGDQYRGQPVPYASYQTYSAYSPSTNHASQGDGGGGGGVGTIQLLHLDNSVGNTATLGGSSYHSAVPIVSVDGTPSYAFPVTEQNSSASSLASSYDTAGSNLEHLPGTDAALWTRVRRNGSGGSLSAYMDNSSARGTAGASAAAASAGPGGAVAKSMMLHSTSDGNINSRRNRSTSYGSTSDTSYYDATSSTMSRTTSVGSWRNNSETTLESRGGGRNIPAVQYTVSSEGGRSGGHDGAGTMVGDEFVMTTSTTPASSNVTSPLRQARVAAMIPHPAGARFRRSPRGRRESDEGFTMMTSALLNMLDAPEELAAYDEDDPRLYYDNMYQTSSSEHPHPDEDFDPAFFERLSLSRMPSSEQRTGFINGADNSWSPTLRRVSSDVGRSPDKDDPLQVVQQHHHATNGPQSHGADVGLFLP